MDTPQKKVENYFKTDRTFREGKILYSQLPGHNKATAMMMRNWQDSPQNQEKIYFHLAQAVGMSDRQLKILTQKPVVKDFSTEQPAAPAAPEKNTEPTPQDRLLSFDKTTANYKDSKKLLAALDLTAASKKKKDVFAALELAKKKAIAKELDQLPDDVKASIKLRDQFPFLKEKDCPDVLKLLVSDLINAYEVFKTNQPKLHDLMDEKTAKAVVDTVKDSYIENKQAFEELEHYGKTKKLLGKHPIFKILKAKEEISAMSTEDLTKKINALRANITRNTQKENQELVDRDRQLLDHATAVLGKR